MIESDFVNVSIRVKPVSEEENQCLQIISKEPPVLLLVDRLQTFVFDNIYTEEVSQQFIYEESVRPFVEYVKQGFNCTVFAYGQTGTGKTYTMGTDSSVKNEEDFGLIPRTLRHFFEYDNDDHSEKEISVSFIEIYNEKVFDLLQNDNKPPLQVKGLKAQGFTQEKVFNSREARHFLQMGNTNRHTGGTKQNPNSSRSHAIFTIYCNVKCEEKESCAKLNLVDLAGCESVRKTCTHGSTFQEGVNINKGLLSIGQVMAALSSNASFVPYRQSVITSILQDSLNKQNFISLIACVSPLAEDLTESLQTLEFAQRVKKMKNKPEVNEVISQYKKDNPLIFQTRYNTPFKRPLAPLTTPRPSKKLKPVDVIPEHNVLNNITDTSQSLKSWSTTSASSVSSLSSTAGSSAFSMESNQQAFSPVIRKYMTAMEASIMDKISTVLEKTIQMPTRSSKLVNDHNKDTPCLPWSIQNEVVKIVKSEMAQLTSAKTGKATSSPIGETLDNVRKMLNYDSSYESVDDKEKKANASSDSTLHVSKIQISRKSTPALSPIPSHPRRSIRLSMKRMNHDFSILKDVSKSGCGSPYQIKKGVRQNSYKENCNEVFDRSRKRGSIIKAKDIKKTKKAPTFKKPMMSLADMPAGKRLLKENNKDTPRTVHTKSVLKVLNSGTVKDIEKLHIVGPKTAQQIHLFRDLKGKLNKISDLKGMHGWGIKKYEKFALQNCLKEELL